MIILLLLYRIIKLFTIKNLRYISIYYARAITKKG